jgi:hypothetical protein
MILDYSPDFGVFMYSQSKCQLLPHSDPGYLVSELRDMKVAIELSFAARMNG